MQYIMLYMYNLLRSTLQISMWAFRFFKIHGNSEDFFKMSLNEDAFYYIGLGFMVISILMLLTYPKEDAKKENKS